MKKISKVLKSMLAAMLAVSLVLNIPVLADAASKTVTVRTQAQLLNALKSGKAAVIKIVTGKKVKLTIPDGYDTADVRLTVNAKNATITNRATFKSIVIEGNGIANYREAAKNNAIKVDAEDANITVTNGAVVDRLTVTGKHANKK